MSEALDRMLCAKRLRGHALATLAPFLMQTPADDEEDARQAATDLLEFYQPTTPRELQLATQAAALAWASLTLLGTGFQAANLSCAVMAEIHEAALKMEVLATNHGKALKAHRRQRGRSSARRIRPDDQRWDEGEFQLVMNRAHDTVIAARARVALLKAA